VCLIKRRISAQVWSQTLMLKLLWVLWGWRRDWNIYFTRHYQTLEGRMYLCERQSIVSNYIFNSIVVFFVSHCTYACLVCIILKINNQYSSCFVQYCFLKSPLCYTPFNIFYKFPLNQIALQQPPRLSDLETVMTRTEYKIMQLPFIAT